MDDDQYQAVRGASNLFSILSPIFSGSVQLSLSLISSLYYTTGVLLPASTKITLLSLSCSSHLHIQDNHNNQRSISQPRHFGVNISLPGRAAFVEYLQPKKRRWCVASAEIAVVGDRGCRPEGLELVTSTGTGRTNLPTCCHLLPHISYPETRPSKPNPYPRYLQSPKTVLLRW